MDVVIKIDFKGKGCEHLAPFLVDVDDWDFSKRGMEIFTNLVISVQNELAIYRRKAGLADPPDITVTDVIPR